MKARIKPAKARTRQGAETGNAAHCVDSIWFTVAFYHNHGGPDAAPGIDLFVRRCIEGGQLTTAAGPVTYPPQLARRQPPKRLGVGACSVFERSRSERVFRNEFSYLGRVGLAAWASFRLAGGDRADCHIAGARTA